MSLDITNNYQRKNELLFCGDPQQILAEMRHTFLLMVPDFDFTLLDQSYQDLIKLFNGDFPGFSASNTKYHNLEHTCAVSLALIRLLHGMQVVGITFPARLLELGLLAAFFHDTGLLPDAHDREGTGAKYMIGHEQRSIAIMSEYLASHGKSALDIQECGQMINCTILNVHPDEELTFNSPEVRKIGCVLGTADLLAQMADRAYLEKLPLLYMEFKEGGIPGYNSTLELFKKTGEFYANVALTRMNNDLDNLAGYLRHHFRERWNIDQDLYDDSIKNQMRYLKMITDTCEDNYSCLLANLRRRP